MGKCRFNSTWLQQKDANGTIISTWAIPFDENNILCCACDKKVLIHRGFQSIEQHSAGERHKRLCKIKFQPKQLHLASSNAQNIKECCETNKNAAPTTPVKALQLFSAKDSAIKAELYWTMWCVLHNYSFKSNDGIASIFSAMFPEVPNHFSISSTKMRYLVTECLGPHFKNKMLNDLQGSYYSLMYDETVNKAGAKECQFQVRYWSSREKQIITKHLDTSYMYHATAIDLSQKINSVIDNCNLPRRKLLMLGSDGPNVCKKVWRLVNEDIKLINQTGLVDIGVCNIHTLHNAFLKGMGNLGNNSSDLIIAIKSFFKDKPSRWEDYQKIQIKLKIAQHSFIKHVPSRWLTIADAANRLLEQWTAVQHYFITFLPKYCTAIQKTSTFKTIYTFLKKPTMKVELLFIISSANLFTKFTGTFQRKEPLIHVIYTEIVLLLKSIMLKFCKKNIVDGLERNLQKNSTAASMFSSENLLELKKIRVGEAAEELKKLPEQDQTLFLYAVKMHYVACCKHILDKSDINQKPILKYLGCVHPNNIKLDKSPYYIGKITKCLPLNIDPEVATDEWKLLSLESLPEYNNNIGIDLYWGNIFDMKRDTGETKFPNLTIILRCLLSLSHGNADVERGFSASGRILTKDRASISANMLNNILYIQDGIKYYNNNITTVPICKELINSAQSAGRRYELFRKEQKQKKEDEDRKEKQRNDEKEAFEKSVKIIEKSKQDIEELEKSILEQEKDIVLRNSIFEGLYFEGNEKLKTALTTNNLIQANIAQSMIEQANTLREAETKKQKELQKQKKSLEKRKSIIINDFLKKEIKTKFVI